MANKFQMPRGTQDIMGEDVSLWLQVEDIIRKECEKYGYQEIRTPVFEHTEVFKFQNDSITYIHIQEQIHKQVVHQN